MTEKITVPGKNKEVELLSLQSRDRADQVDFPTGSYWYVRLGPQQLILKNLSKDRILEHIQMIPPDQIFNPDQDDAGCLSLANRLTEAEIQSMINGFTYQGFNKEAYRKQLEQITNSIEIDHKAGSTSLNYSPKPANRQTTAELLRIFFSNHQVTESAN